MKLIVKPLTYIFILIGITLLVAFITKIFGDHRINVTQDLDFKYLKNLGESAQVLSIAWSIIGVFLLIHTLNIQREQFNDNRNFIEKQQFETTFFNMLNVLYNIKNSMKKQVSIDNLSEVFQGQNLIDLIKEDLNKEYDIYISTLKEAEPFNLILRKITNNKPLEQLERDILKDQINTIYLSFYKKYHSQLGHFFRYLYNLIKFTVENRAKFKDDRVYINLVQAQLSNNELALVFYNVLSNMALSQGKIPKFYDYLDTYGFFENIDENALINREHHVLFPLTTFKFLNRDEINLRNNGR